MKEQYILYQNKKFNKNNEFIEFFLFIIYKVLFELYLPIISIIYNIEIKTSLEKFILGWTVYILIVIISINRLKDQYYSVVFKFLFILGGMSTIAIFEMQAIDLSAFFKAITYWMLLLYAFILIQKVEFKDSFSTNTKRVQNLQSYLLVFCVIFSILLSGIYTGFRISISFEDSLSHRLEMRMAGMPTIINYLFSFVGGAILPYCFAFFTSRRWYFSASVALFTGIILFSINGMKTWLLVYLLIVGIFISVRINKKKIISFVLLAMCIWMLLSAFLLYRNGSLDLITLFKRTVYIPSESGYLYISFFDKNTYLFLRESILKYFFDSPYPFPVSYYIVDGNSTDLNTTANANNGLWGDAYANFAFLGILIYPFILVTIMKIVRNSMKGEDLRLIISVAFILLWSAINIPLFVWLISGGVIIIFIINKFSPIPQNIDERFIID